MIVVGVDPGGRWTGVVTRRGDDLLYADVATRQTDQPLPDARYLQTCLASVRAALEIGQQTDTDTIIAVESVEDWNAGDDGPRRNMRGLLGTAMVIGAVCARWPQAVLVAPGGHGDLHLLAYPARLRQGYKIEHARSAYDISHAGETIVKQERRSRAV